MQVSKSRKDQSRKKKIKHQLQECTYKVSGMHCASCEILIEKKLLKHFAVQAVEASTAREEVFFEFEGIKPTLTAINQLFKTDGYSFRELQAPPSSSSADSSTLESSEQPLLRITTQGSLLVNLQKIRSIFLIGVALLFVYLVYILFDRSGLAALVSLQENSALPAFFVFGLVAGVSSCAALVGGIVLSMSKQWYELHAQSNSFRIKAEPHLLFNLGRIISYTLLGGVLGALGSVFKLSFEFTAILTIGVSILMIMLGLQMLGVRALQRFQLTIPKGITRYIADEQNFSGKYLPFIMGALTFFLPCGFTITVQGLAMVSGSPIQGALMLGLFALGTSPMLLAIGLSSTKLLSKGQLALNFLKLVGILVIIFGLANINAQFTVLGLN